MKLGLNVQARPHAPQVLLRTSHKPVLRLKLRWPLLLCAAVSLAFWAALFLGVSWLLR